MVRHYNGPGEVWWAADVLEAELGKGKMLLSTLQIINYLGKDPVADKLLFNSGSFTVTTRARGVLEKIAKVISDKPDLEFMVEGHTDNMPIDQEKAAETIPGVVDNWDLSVKRATSVVRILQNSYGVDPTKLVAAGRSFYMPIADNDSSVTRAVNRRTRIVVLPKLDQFTKLIEEGMSMNVPATGPSDTISSDNKPD